MEMNIICILPDYCPRIDESSSEARDLDLPEMRRNYPNGFKCCGVHYTPAKYSQFRTHMKRPIHKKNVLDPKTQEHKENLGDCDTLLEAFDKKCKEIRQLKKLISQKEKDIENEKVIKERFLNSNLELQEEITELKKKTKPTKIIVKEANLIDM
jgi:hypothetical protein